MAQMAAFPLFVALHTGAAVGTEVVGGAPPPPPPPPPIKLVPSPPKPCEAAPAQVSTATARSSNAPRHPGMA